MRALVNKILIALILLIGSIHLSAQNTATSGDWQDKNIWEGKVTVPINIGNSYKFDSIVVKNNHVLQLGSLLNNKDLNISNNGFQLKVYGELTIHGSLIANNSMTIFIAPGGKLVINGSVSVDNGLIINVSDGGTFVINGTVTMKNDAAIEVDGVLVADAIVGKNGNTITGNGELYVDTITGVATDGFKGVIVGDDTSLYFASPTDLTAVVSGELKVSLDWDFAEIAVEGFNYVGFQVFRNLGGSLHYDEIVFGDILDGNFTGDTVSSFTDPYQYEPGATPKYYVRAVYQSWLKSVTYSYSPVSNNVDFSEEPLPIELIFFTAEAANEVVNLNWATATEINNDFFTIERSLNGSTWEIVDFLTGAGNANYMIEYSFTDANPYQGVSYYRLKQTDYDGKFEYFAPVAVNMTKSAGLSEIVNVTFNSTSMDVWFQNEQQNSILLVADIQGRIIAQQTLNSKDFVQNVKVNFPRNYSGEVVMVRLVSAEKSDERKYMVR